jgi:hypothetical protein
MRISNGRKNATFAPFNLQGGGLWFFVSFRNIFSDNTRVRILFFWSRKAQFFFPEFNIWLYDKNSESDYYFFQQHWEVNGRSLKF